ncbi:MAG: hypothetical protein IT458_15765 [Planctomycetes bacterium]|nr:hypothetical protein [Planctomycetota bacterium]
MGERIGTSAWRRQIHARFPGHPTPVFVFGEEIVPASALWSGARRWVDAFRGLSLPAGSRLALTLPPGAAFLQVFLAALWEDTHLVLDAPGSEIEPLFATHGCAAGILLVDGAPIVVAAPTGAHRWIPLEATGAPVARHAQARFVVRDAADRFTSVPDAQALQAVRTLTFTDEFVSSQPWHTREGVLHDLLQVLFASGHVVRAGAGHDAEVFARARARS